MAKTVHHPQCRALETGDADRCTCGGSALPVYEPDPLLERMLGKFDRALNRQLTFDDARAMAGGGEA